jgi:ArsR family transcriptional regulator, arsenate/arsenite/antimonite-responsive transcriptional repressor
MKSNDVVAALGALASQPRLAVYRLLVKRGPDGYTPGELAGRLGLPAPTLSFHLRELLQAKLLKSRREGRNLFYSPAFERMNEVIGFLNENCCSLADEACDADCKPISTPLPQRKSA